ncbi:hypothetical protein F2Q69_00012820 [Brassica cretica]|uniref:Hyaluronan/mRNA-binding protein domain-containing protein n=1 Tax=Brassica cretica TaxID=69181 RepID=A0A8S9R7E1_BRACR|nr:hypothetical protein F2Q69_00012820 [Brassica cretica]
MGVIGSCCSLGGGGGTGGVFLAGDGELPRRTFERHSGNGREGDIKSEEAGCGNWGTPGEKIVVVETEEVAGVETEKPAGDEVAADANKENTAEVEEQKESEDKPLYEKRSVYGGARRGGGRRGEAGDGERPRRTFERHSGTGREGDIKSEEAGCGNWGTPGEEVVVVETEEVAGVETEKPAGDEVAADANKENTAEVEEQKESEDKGSDREKHKDDKEDKAKKAVNINEFLKPSEGENYYRGGGRGGRGRGRGGRDGEGEGENYYRGGGRGGRGRGRGGRDGEGASGGGFDGYRSEVAPAIGDTAQFPSLGGK